MPKTLSYISYEAFWGCNNIKQVTLKNSHTDFNVFYKKHSFNIKPEITYPFEGMKMMKNVYVPRGTKEWYSKFIRNDLIVEKDILE